jgi:hypothetical protein
MSKDLIRIARPFTMISDERIIALATAVEKVNEENIEGSLVECGTWKGGALAVMSITDRACGCQRQVFGFDSFEGLPAPAEIDSPAAQEWSGKLKVTTNDVNENLSTMSASAILVKGLFEDTLVKSREIVGKIAVLRLDGDWHSSTTTCLEALYDLVSPGGFVIIDDYGHWIGCKKAVDDFRALKNIASPMTHTDYTEVWWRK